MRTSLVLLAVLSACSDSSGPRHVPVLTTQLSSTVDSINGELFVTLSASNPTDTTLHLVFSTPPVLAEVKVSGQWQIGTGFGDGFGPGGDDTLSLAPGAVAQLGTATVQFLLPGPHLSVASTVPPNTETFYLSPGAYSVRGCYYPDTGLSPGGGILYPACGNSVTLTLTQ